MDDMTLFESYQYVNDCLDINEYIEFVNEQCDDGICEICESYNNGYITEEVANALLDVLYEATKEEIDKWLKSYDYDPKSKTININGSRRRISIGDSGDKDVDSMGPSIGVYPKHDANINSKLYDELSSHGKDHIKAASKLGYKLDKYGIRIPQNTLGMDISHFDNAIEHEAGHIKDLSNHRILNRLPSLFSKYNYNDIPKEYRSKFLAMKKDMKAGKINPNDSKVKSFMKDVEKAVIVAKKDSDYKLKAAYDKINNDIEDLHNVSKKKSLLANAKAIGKKLTTNDHDKLHDEIRADLISDESLHKRGKNAQLYGHFLGKGGVRDAILNYGVDGTAHNQVQPSIRSAIKNVGSKVDDKIFDTKLALSTRNRDNNIKKLSGTEELKYIANYKKKGDKKK